MFYASGFKFLVLPAYLGYIFGTLDSNHNRELMFIIRVHIFLSNAIYYVNL